MPNKKNAKPVWVNGDIYASFKARLALEDWTWGITKKVESLMKDYLQVANRAAGQQAERGGDLSAWDAVPPASSTFGARPKVKRLPKPKVSNE